MSSTFNARQLEAALVQNATQLFRHISKRKRTYSAIAIASFLINYYFQSRKKKNKEIENQKNANIDKRKLFYPQLKQLIRIVLPGVRTKEAFLLAVHTAFLVSRTFLSIYVANLDGVMVKSIVDRDGREFLISLAKWLGVAIPATYVNSMIKYLESKLAIAFRTRLVQHAYDLYMKDETYYKVGNLDSRLANADQCLTEDVSKFCSGLAHLHSQLSKPLLDVILMSAELLRMNAQKDRGNGLASTLLSVFVIWLTARVLKLCQPPFGKLVAEEARLGGVVRFVHSRLITNSEEIAFYRGDKIELSILQTTYMNLIKHMNYIFRARIFYNMLEGFFMKYVWSASGLLMIAIPAFLYEKPEASVTSEVVSARTQDYVTAKKLLMNGAEAIERIMLAYKEIKELTGYTSRVAEMLQVFEDVKKGNYQKNMLQESTLEIRGRAIEGDTVKFEGVPIVSPNGDILVQSLSFEAKPGMHTLITGPNGCGKSSLFRILGGLWPVYAGIVVRPKDIFYIPQRPYLSIGNFRDQLIYPDTVEVMKAKQITDADLEEILGWVNLKHILEREGGWESTNDWKDVLSGGEKQRLGMARVFYHRPHYAILDECTSAVSIDVEGKMYQHAIDLNITLLTVTHRPSLWKYHTHLLQFDGEGGWKFSELNAEVRGSLKEEKSKLEASLQGVPKMQQRLKELCILLGEDSILLSEEKGEEDPSVENSPVMA